MQYTVRLFVVPCGTSPAGPPQPPETFSIEASGIDAARAVARHEVERRGLHLRSLSFSPSGIVVYVQESA